MNLFYCLLVNQDEPIWKLLELGVGSGLSILVNTGILNAFPKHNATPGLNVFNLSTSAVDILCVKF